MKIIKPGPTAESWTHAQSCFDCGAQVEIRVPDVVEASTPLSGAVFRCVCGKENRVESRVMPEVVWRGVQVAAAARIAAKKDAAAA